MHVRTVTCEVFVCTRCCFLSKHRSVQRVKFSIRYWFPSCDSFSNRDKQGQAVCNMRLYESQPCFDFLIRAAWRSFHVDQNGTTKMEKVEGTRWDCVMLEKPVGRYLPKKMKTRLHKAVIVSLTAQNQDYEDIKSKMRKMLRTSSFNHPAADQKCAGRSGGDNISRFYFPYPAI